MPLYFCSKSPYAESIFCFAFLRAANNLAKLYIRLGCALRKSPPTTKSVRGSQHSLCWSSEPLTYTAQTLQILYVKCRRQGKNFEVGFKANLRKFLQDWFLSLTKTHHCIWLHFSHNHRVIYSCICDHRSAKVSKRIQATGSA